MTRTDHDKPLDDAWQVALKRMRGIPSLWDYAPMAGEEATKAEANKPGPKEPDPFQEATDDAWARLTARSTKLSAKQEQVLTAHEGAIKSAASIQARPGASCFTAAFKAVKLKAPEGQRGTPLVDPGEWRRHVEDLGLPTGTPPPTVRIADFATLSWPLSMV